MKKIVEYFKDLRSNPNNHIGLGDVRLTIGQQYDILTIINSCAPAEIVENYKKWKSDHPNEDYQIDEINEFYSKLDRSDKVQIMEFLESFFECE
jgi:hypothetical protein